MTKRSILVSAFYDQIPLEAIKNKYTERAVKEVLSGYQGVYALYDGDELYYIGKGNLYTRIKDHLVDKHKGKWDSFAFAILDRPQFKEEIESLLLSFGKELPPGNEIRPKLVRDEETRAEILKVIEFVGKSTYKSMTKKIPTESTHVEFGDSDTKSLYSQLKLKIKSLGRDVKSVSKQKYISFIRNTNFVDVEVQKHNLKLHINLKKGVLSDPNNLARDVSNIGHWGNGDYELQIKDPTTLDYVLILIKQSYETN